MPIILSQLWESIVEASASFDMFVYWLEEFAIRFFESDLAIGLFGADATLDTVIDKYGFLPYVFMLFGLLEAFFGRRFFKLQKLILGFIVGFALGSVYIAPIISAMNVVDIDGVIIGLAFGIVMAFFRSPLYWTAFVFTTFYISYYYLINSLSFAKFPALLVSSLLVLLVVIFLLRWIELIGTAILGGWIFATVFSWSINVSDTAETVITVIITVLIAALGFFVQYRHDLVVKKTKKERKIEILMK